MGEHLIDGKFQSDKYPTCPRGLVPVSTNDRLAQDLLWRLAERYDAVDAEFAADLRQALANDGYVSAGKKPKVIVLCGSTRFVEIMAVCAWVLERDELAITLGLHLLPIWYPNVPGDHLAEAEGVKDALDWLHLRKIDLADEIFVANVEGYIGESCANEVRHAEARGLPIRYYETDTVGAVVRGMIAEARAGAGP